MYAFLTRMILFGALRSTWHDSALGPVLPPFFRRSTDFRIKSAT